MTFRGISGSRVSVRVFRALYPQFEGYNPHRRESAGRKASFSKAGRATLLVFLGVSRGEAFAQEKPEQVVPERARANFGRPVVLRAEDVRAFPDAPAGFDSAREGGLSGCTEVFEYESTVTGVRRKVVVYLPPHYSASTNREQRAIAGLSMGGGQALNFGLQHLDTFAWVGGFLSAPNTKSSAGLVPDPVAAREQLKLLHLSCGTQDGLINISQGVEAYLKQHNVPHIWNVDEHGHDAGTWGSNLYHFARRLFIARK
jgi:enterochelin esterase-like enzyme